MLDTKLQRAFAIQSGLNDVLGTYSPTTSEIEILATNVAKLGLSKHFVASVVQHEMYHFFQCISTSFGIAQWARLWQTVVLVRKLSDFCRRVIKAQVSVPIRWFGERVKLPEIAVLIASIEESLARDQWFSGSPNQISESLAPDTVGSTGFLDKPKTSVHPIVQFDGGFPFHFGAAAVLEGAAWLTQLSGLAYSLGPSSPEAKVLAENVPWVYKAGPCLAAHFWGSRFSTILYLLVSDLALWSPIGSCYEQEPCYAWEDVHPGWRFLRIVKLISDWDEVPSDQNLVDRKEYCHFVERICRGISPSWKSPIDMASDCLRATRDRPITHVLDSLHVESCRLRIEYPPDLFAPYRGFDVLARVLKSCPPLLVNVQDFSVLPEGWAHLLKTSSKFADDHLRPALEPIIAGSAIARDLFFSETLQCPRLLFSKCAVRRKNCEGEQSPSQLPEHCSLRQHVNSLLGPVEEIHHVDSWAD